jgi:hypothetical protein
MPTAKIIGKEVNGVTTEDNPFGLSNRYLVHARNIQIDRGILKTRPGFVREPLGMKAPFQGATIYRPGRGVSAKQESDDNLYLAVAAGGEISLTGLESCKMGSYQVLCNSGMGDNVVHLLSAEQWLIATAEGQNTKWWTPGQDCFTTSPGLADCNLEDLPEDTFCKESWVHWLVNGAGLTAYVHGRVHQSVGRRLYISDMIYKRGINTDTDILRMWEQSQSSYGDVQCLSTRAGDIVALEVLPATTTPNGEGDLVAYTERGVFTFNTFEYPRKTVVSATGETVSKGWAYKRLKDQRMMHITACGRYAVAVSPRDHFFRSKYGLFSLKLSLESGTLKDEPIDNLSWQVKSLLQENDELLKGVSTGYWIEGQRIFTSTEMAYDAGVAVEPFGRSFAVYNKVISQTVEGTPVQGWEGLWSSPNMNIHRFMPNDGQDFLMLTSEDGKFEATHVLEDAIVDIKADGTKQEIEWEIETGKTNFGSAANLSTISEGYFEAISRSKDFKVTIYVKTDKTLCWKEWKTFGSCDKDGEMFFIGQPLGRPDASTREGSWFEFRIVGTGSMEIHHFNVDVALGDAKINRAVCVAVN